MSIMDKLQKNSKIKETSILADSKFFTEKDMVATSVPMINVALSGSLDGGLAPGLTVLAGPSKHFKTSFGLIMAAAYLKNIKMLYSYFMIQSLVHLKLILNNMKLTRQEFFILQLKTLKN